MSWLIHRWLFLYGISLLVFKDCESFFLRHAKTGKCITRSGELVYNNPSHALPYWVVMTDNCLDVNAKFRYLDTELLHNIEANATFGSTSGSSFKNRLFVYKGISTNGKDYQKRTEHRLKQSAAGSLSFYTKSICGQPNVNSLYVDRKTFCDKTEQKFTFGSVTQYGTKMKDVHCSPIQLMVVKKADYGDFNNSGTFDGSATSDTQCSAVTNCQVKSLCGGNRSCELTIDNNVLPSHLCSDTTKELYTEYTCVDIAPNIRLSRAYEGTINVYDGSIWRIVDEENWDKDRQKMLCQHLGFSETDGNDISNKETEKDQNNIATGDLVCYNTQSSGTSCCVHLQPSTTTTKVTLPYAKCKICDKQLLVDTGIFPDSIFSGGGSSNYERARFTKSGWCASNSGSYLLIDLQKEYHITRVVTMGNKDRTKWCGSYSLKYSHDKTYKNSEKITGNSNGYQASTTSVNIYNVRYIRIQPTGCQDLCLRIELCGEVQTPAPVYDVQITPLKNSALVTLKIQTSASASSYITKLRIYLNSKYHQTVYRGNHNQFNINNLNTYTDYTVGILAGDGNSQNSTIKYIKFKTKAAEETVSNQNSEQCTEDKTRMDLLIPLAILALCFLLSLGVNIYQRRRLQNRNREKSRKPQTLRQVDQKGKFDSIPEPPSSSISMNVIQAAPNDSLVQDEYEGVIKRVGRNEAESTPDITTGQESSTYMSLKANREPDNFYQTLGTSADVHRTKKGDDQSSTYMSLKDNKEPPNFYEPLQPPVTSAGPYHTKDSDDHIGEYVNSAF